MVTKHKFMKISPVLEDPGVPPRFQRSYPLLIHGLILAGTLRLIETPDGGSIVDPEQRIKLHRKLWAANKPVKKG
jgi:hypothetical protein